MTITQQQGRTANRTGRHAEHVIADTLSRRGIAFERQWPAGRSVFDTALVADFYLPNLATGIIIESKWQQVPGSAEEKLCFLVENIRHDCYPCPVIIVIDGGGFRPNALAWLRAQVDGKRLYAVLSIVEFLTWCNQAL